MIRELTVRKAANREKAHFEKAVKRAFELYGKLSKAKVPEGPAQRLRGLRAPDQRDLAQFIFLDVAAQWEAFCVSIFAIEVKKRYRVRNYAVVERIMGTVDGARPQGYADPARIVNRATVLFGSTSPWTKFAHALGSPVVNYLNYGQIIRNFIAHAGIGKGRENFHGLLAQLNIPIGVRKGLSAGRLLLDYRDSSGDKWFEALLNNYLAVARYIANNLR